MTNAFLVSGEERKALSSYETSATANARLVRFPILKPGKLKLTIESASYTNGICDFDVGDQGGVLRTNLIPVLKRAHGILSLSSTSTVKNVEVLVDDKVYSTNWPWSGGVEVGEHTVALRYSGRLSEKRKVQIAKGQSYSEVFVIEPIPPSHSVTLVPGDTNTTLELVWVRNVTNTANNAGCWVAKYEITRAQYSAFAKDPPFAPGDALMPVVNVTWADALRFCEWLNTIDKYKPPDAKYTLPSSAQWESFSGEKHRSTNSAVVNTKAAVFANDGVTNQFGLFHAWGNVWEWCKGPGTTMVRRGCSYRSLGRSLFEGIGGASPAKLDHAQTVKDIDIGFRVILILVPPEMAQAQK